MSVGVYQHVALLFVRLFTSFFRQLIYGLRLPVLFTCLSRRADIESIDALCDALRLYNGGVVLVSHDARLIETTECQLWVVENQGLTPWEEGFANYRQHLLKQLEDQLNAIMPGSGERPK
jgi:hypothetical protein